MLAATLAVVARAENHRTTRARQATQAESHPTYPAVKGYGPAYSVPDAVDHPQPTQRWKALYNLTKRADKPDKPIPGLTHAARLYNVLASVSVPPRKVRLVAIAHGPATDAMLDNSAYRAKHGVDNPNLEVIRGLERNGAKVLVCGQALADSRIPHEQVAEEVGVAVSALVVLVQYQVQDYALMQY